MGVIPALLLIVSSVVSVTGFGVLLGKKDRQDDRDFRAKEDRAVQRALDLRKLSS